MSILLLGAEEKARISATIVLRHIPGFSHWQLESDETNIMTGPYVNLHDAIDANTMSNRS